MVVRDRPKMKLIQADQVGAMSKMMEERKKQGRQGRVRSARPGVVGRVKTGRGRQLPAGRFEAGGSRGS